MSHAYVTLGVLLDADTEWTVQAGRDTTAIVSSGQLHISGQHPLHLRAMARALMDAADISQALMDGQDVNELEHD
jgi:hypothetical protein